MKLKKGLMLMAIVAILFAACKDDETDPVAKTKTEMITSGSWVLSDALLNGSSFFGTMDDCEKDDFLTFKTNGDAITDEGPTKCDPADPQTETGTWKFSTDEKKITFDGDLGDLTSLTDAELVITMTDSLDVSVLKFKKK